MWARAVRSSITPRPRSSRKLVAPAPTARARRRVGWWGVLVAGCWWLRSATRGQTRNASFRRAEVGVRRAGRKQLDHGGHRGHGGQPEALGGPRHEPGFLGNGLGRLLASRGRSPFSMALARWRCGWARSPSATFCVARDSGRSQAFCVLLPKTSRPRHRGWRWDAVAPSARGAPPNGKAVLRVLRGPIAVGPARWIEESAARLERYCQWRDPRSP